MIRGNATQIPPTKPRDLAVLVARWLGGSGVTVLDGRDLVRARRVPLPSNSQPLSLSACDRSSTTFEPEGWRVGWLVAGRGAHQRLEVLLGRGPVPLRTPQRFLCQETQPSDGR